MEASSGTTPDQSSYWRVVGAAMRSKAFDSVPRILEIMEDSGVRPDHHFVEKVWACLHVYHMCQQNKLGFICGKRFVSASMG
eukprot:22985-Eustigmatos_ZCMA.PRE.1